MNAQIIETLANTFAKNNRVSKAKVLEFATNFYNNSANPDEFTKQIKVGKARITDLCVAIADLRVSETPVTEKKKRVRHSETKFYEATKSLLNAAAGGFEFTIPEAMNLSGCSYGIVFSVIKRLCKEGALRVVSKRETGLKVGRKNQVFGRC